MCISASPVSPTRRISNPARAARCSAASPRYLRCRIPTRPPPMPAPSPTRSSAPITACIAISRETGKRVHVLHVTTKDEAAFLGGHKDVATAEATPAHLTLAAPECYERLGTLAQLNPPIRDAAHREGLWHGIAQGVIDSIGSDHSPHTREEKAHPYPKTHSGMTGVQTLVPIMLDHVNAGRLSLLRLVDLTSAGPARLFSIAAKGRIAVGYDADLTVVDLKRRETITERWIASRAGWTPYAGVTVTGWPVGTVIRGHKAMWEGSLTAPAQGERVRFLETLAS